jgi:hypothetical protein
MTRARDIADSQDNLGGAVPPFTAGKNKFINGDFTINQRGFISDTVNGLYAFDRWQNTVIGTSGTSTFSAQTFTPGTAPVAGYEAQNYLRVVTTGQSTTDTLTLVRQALEDVRTFAGQTVTISFWAKAASGTPKVAISWAQRFGSGGSPSATAEAPAGFVTLSTSWARYSLTYAVPSISGKTIGTDVNSSNSRVQFFLSAGSVYAVNSSSIGIQNNTFELWGMQVEAGSIATPFTTATGSIQGELAACQRYYWRANTLQQISGAVSTTIVDTIVIPPTMRQGAVSHEISGGGVYSMAGGGAPSYTSGTWSIVSTGTNYSTLRYTHGSAVFTAGTLWQLSSTYFALSAEL